MIWERKKEGYPCAREGMGEMCMYTDTNDEMIYQKSVAECILQIVPFCFSLRGTVYLRRGNSFARLCRPDHRRAQTTIPNAGPTSPLSARVLPTFTFTCYVQQARRGKNLAWLCLRY